MKRLLLAAIVKMAASGPACAQSSTATGAGVGTARSTSQEISGQAGTGVGVGGNPSATITSNSTVPAHCTYSGRETAKTQLHLNGLSPLAPIRSIFVVVCAMGVTGCAHYPARRDLEAMNVRVRAHVRVDSKERQHAEFHGRRRDPSGNSKRTGEPVGPVALPLQKRAELTPGCTHFRSYDPVSGIYMAYGGSRRPCTAATPARETNPVEKERLDPVETVAGNNADKPPSPPEGDADLLIAILMARPEITSISDLAGKSVAIDDKYSASNGNVRIAIVAAGAPEVQLRENQTAAIDRLVSGDVPAAVLALTSARAADGFPEISGYKIFHIPLSPRSPEGPASDAAVGIAR